VRLGTTLYHQGDSGAEQTLKGIDGTLRYMPGTWSKVGVAQSSGIGSDNLSSVSGGFDFNQNNSTGQLADAKRVDVAVNLAELNPDANGHLSAYWLEQDAGFSGPGLITPNSEALHQLGLAVVLPVGARSEIAVKTDNRDSISESANTTEAALRHKIDAEWGAEYAMTIAAMTVPSITLPLPARCWTRPARATI
jgi:hypothetical protein